MMRIVIAAAVCFAIAMAHDGFEDSFDYGGFGGPVIGGGYHSGGIVGGYHGSYHGGYHGGFQKGFLPPPIITKKILRPIIHPPIVHKMPIFKGPVFPSYHVPAPVKSIGGYY